MNNECEGCIDNRRKIMDCDKKKLKDPCPCKVCLVKVMCSSACKEYMEYTSRNTTFPVARKRWRLT